VLWKVGRDEDELARVRCERDELQSLLDKFERHMAEVLCSCWISAIWFVGINQELLMFLYKVNHGGEFFSVLMVFNALLWSSSLLCCRPDGLELYHTASETQFSAAAALGNYSRRTFSTVTQHTQRSRNAVWLRCINVQLTLTLLLWHLDKMYL